MRIGIVLTPISDHHLRLASQVGVSDVVIRFPGLDYSDLAYQKARNRVLRFAGLRLSRAICPLRTSRSGGPQRDAEIEQMKTLIGNMGACRDRPALLQLHRRRRLGQDFGPANRAAEAPWSPAST